MNDRKTTPVAGAGKPFKHDPPGDPSVKPPGRVSNRAVHGPQGPAPVALTPIEQLRSVLRLSDGVADNDVILEAVARLEKRVHGPRHIDTGEDD